LMASQGAVVGRITLMTSREAVVRKINLMTSQGVLNAVYVNDVTRS
jgi:hypothetical protein